MVMCSERKLQLEGAQAASSTWTGWAVTGVSSLTSKLYKQKPEERLQGRVPHVTRPAGQSVG